MNDVRILSCRTISIVDGNEFRDTNKSRTGSTLIRYARLRLPLRPCVDCGVCLHRKYRVTGPQNDGLSLYLPEDVEEFLVFH